MGPAVQSGRWVFTSCRSLLQHCSGFHLLASSSKMHVNWGLCEGFPPMGWIPVPVQGICTSTCLSCPIAWGPGDPIHPPTCPSGVADPFLALS